MDCGRFLGPQLNLCKLCLALKMLAFTGLVDYIYYARGIFYGATAPSGPRPSQCRGFAITLGHTTVCRTPLGEWSARRRDLYLTTPNSLKRQISMPAAGFELAIPASERPQTHALYPAHTGLGTWENTHTNSVCIYIGHKEVYRILRHGVLSLFRFPQTAVNSVVLSFLSK